MNLTTKYLGLELKNPLVASASPISKTLDGIRRLNDAGASAVVLFSLFEEQIRYEQESYEFLVGRGTESFAESLSYFPTITEYHVGPQAYLRLIHDAARAVDIPIIASLNGVSDEGWTQYAKDMIDAGASAIELNIYHLPADTHLTAQAVEDRYLEIVRNVRSAIDAPIAVKLSPYFSSVGYFARRVVEAGADGLVLFNRFYQPDLDIENLEIIPSLELSTSNDIRLPLLWIATLYKQLNSSLAATSGVESHREAIKYLMAGADAVMTTSALLRNGESFLATLLQGLKDWMERKEYESVAQMKGCLSRTNVQDPSAYERANYLKVLHRYEPTYQAF